MTWSSPISWLANRNIRGTVPLGGEVWLVWGSESLIQNSMICLKQRICYNQRWLNTLKRGLHSSPIDTQLSQHGNVPWHKCLPQRVRCIFRIEIWKRVKLSRSREEEYSFGFFFWRLARGVILGRVLCCWMSNFLLLLFFL